MYTAGGGSGGSAAAAGVTSKQRQNQLLPKHQTINQLHTMGGSRNLEELNLFFDENDDLCERMGSGLLLIDDSSGGRKLTKSPEVSDHIQFLITEVPGGDSDDASNGDGTKKFKDEKKETSDDCDLVANGMYEQYQSILDIFLGLMDSRTPTAFLFLRHRVLVLLLFIIASFLLLVIRFHPKILFTLRETANKTHFI